MGKIDVNKKEKTKALFSTAFQLFTDKGFAKTTISDIVNEAGLAKGTFYLYFKDKYDLRDKLIIHKTSQLFDDAREAISHVEIESFDDKLIWIVDYMISRLRNDTTLLSFIAKNLSWGVFQVAFEKTMPDESKQFYQYYMEEMEQAQVACRQPELMLFTIIELVGSTCYSCILYKQPVTIDEYLPYLHQSIRQIIRAYIEPTAA